METGRESGRDQGLISCMGCGSPVKPFGPYIHGDCLFCERCMGVRFGVKRQGKGVNETIGMIAASVIVAAVCICCAAGAIWLLRAAFS